MDTGEWYLDTAEYGQLFGQLGGAVQFRNAQTVLGALSLLDELGVDIPREAVREGFEHVVELTGLMGRWQVLQDKPKVVCDTGHKPRWLAIPAIQPGKPETDDTPHDNDRRHGK